MSTETGTECDDELNYTEESFCNNVGECKGVINWCKKDGEVICKVGSDCQYQGTTEFS